MTSREEILARLRNNRPPHSTDYVLPSLPLLGERTATRQRFEENLKALGGQVLEQQEGEIFSEAIARCFP